MSDAVLSGHGRTGRARAGLRRSPPWFADTVTVVAWCAVWVALWSIASALAVNYGISAWYPPAAISLVVLIRYGPPAAAAIFVASLVAGAGQWAAYPDLNAVAGSLSHAASYLVAAQHYRRRAQGRLFSIRPLTLAAFVQAALVGAALSSLLGNLNIAIASHGDYAVTFERWFAWAIGDLFGVLSLGPALLFAGPRLRAMRATPGAIWSALRVPLAGLSVAIAIASGFALVSGGPDVDFRRVAVVGVGVYSVILAYLASPRSAVIYLFLVATISAAWLSTQVAPQARTEFALQIATFLTASLAMSYLSMQNMRARVETTNRRQRIRDLSAQRDALSQRIGAVEAEFAQLAHEFKTPLGGIIGLLDLAEGGVATGDGREKIEQRFRHMRGCALYLNAMVDDAFDLARLARGRFEPTIAEIDVAELLRELASIARAKAGGSVGFPADTATRGLRVRSDRNRLLQILINLVVNAVRYADRRESVRVFCSAGPETVTIGVENASSALTKAQLDARIAGGEGIAANSQGLGIGLPLVGRLADRIGVRLSTAVADGVVTVSVAAPRA